MNIFTRNIEELIPRLTKQKQSLRRYIHRNFTENIHFIETLHNAHNDKIKKRGGHNRIDIFLTVEAFELLENTYNLRNRDIAKITDTVKVFKILPCIESQTIGFIANTYINCVETFRQFIIGNYRVDLYFPRYKIIVECDEFGHVDRDKYYEIEREKYLLSLGNTIIRFNPNVIDFDLSQVVNRINCIIILP